ncbi:hypothetical protein ABPG72_008439 [Tetrahymena utriculariae]
MMKSCIFIPIILVAALIAVGTGISRNSSRNLKIENDESVQGYIPPLQNGPIPLNGKYYVSTFEKLNATNYNIYVNYNGGEAYYGMVKNRLITNLLVQIVINGKNQLGIKITDRVHRRFEVPHNKLFPHDKVFNFPQNNNFEISIPQSGQQFSITIKRKDTGEVVFDTSNKFLVFSDLYNYISIDMKNEYIYGLGERRNKQFVYTDGKYTFLNKDQYMEVSDGQADQQTYGTHPMYLRREKSGNFHIVFLRNFNSIQAEYKKNEYLTFIVVGGLLEFKIFLGDKNPETSLTQYHQYVNGFTLHPFWAHGYHQCRWGYNTSEKMTDVWNQFNKLDLPIDTIWSDIDYMHELTDFTIDTSRYNITEMNNMLNRNVPKGLHWVPIIDAGIAIGDVSNQRGKELGVYQKSNKTGKDLIGCVWPGKVNYPDFNHPKSYDFWAEGLMNLTKNYNITPSGFWIDMNEFSNFINGEISDDEVCIMPNDPNAPIHEAYLGIRVEDFYSRIPFFVGGIGHPLQEKTMSYDAPKYNSPDAKTVYFPNYNLREFDFHNLNGFSEGIATNYALKKMGYKLPFIISRSQIAGSGQFVQHWTGDNGSNWDFLKYSLSEIFNYNLYGIPMTGVDICGFATNTTAELCARWMQVGAFYPFSRNHNSNDTISQEPYSFKEDYVLSSSRKSLKLRYALLKQYYAYFILSNGVGSIFRPSFFNFPDDENLLTNDKQFMIADSLLGQPVLTQSNNPKQQNTNISLYFPQGGAFYDFISDLSNLTTKRYTSNDNNKNKTVKFDDIMPLYIREGYIVFTQLTNTQNRARLLNSNFEIHVAFQKQQDNTYFAQGRFVALQDYSDDSLINKCIGDNNCGFGIQITGTVEKQNLKLSILIVGQTKKTNFDSIQVTKIIPYASDLKFGSSTGVFEIKQSGTIESSIPLQTATEQI